MTSDLQSPTEAASLMEQILYEVKKVVVGQDRFLERVLVALLAGGHLLVEGVPGLAKTLTVNTLAHAVQGSFKRIQFTPDLVPADLVGTRIYSQKTGEFSTSLGPVFCNLLLADEINRAPAKVQSALLEVMQERQVTIAGQTHKVPSPFVVMATQNPIETEGTYPLPEAQVDRFLMKVLVDYPTEAEEFVIVSRVTGAAQAAATIATTEQLVALQAQCRALFVDPALVQFAVKVVGATRNPARAGLADTGRLITYGASPRGSINMIEAGRALAFLRGRSYVLPEDVLDVTADVLRHRIVLSYDRRSPKGWAPTTSSAAFSRPYPRPKSRWRPMPKSPHQPEALLRRLEWTVIRRMDGLLQGDYRTLFRGFGLDLADLREYQPYDDVRHIDWNVTARTQVPHVRVYNEDRDMTAWFPARSEPLDGTGVRAGCWQAAGADRVHGGAGAVADQSRQPRGCHPLQRHVGLRHRAAIQPAARAQPAGTDFFAPAPVAQPRDRSRGIPASCRRGHPAAVAGLRRLGLHLEAQLAAGPGLTQPAA